MPIVLDHLDGLEIDGVQVGDKVIIEVEGKLFGLRRGIKISFNRQKVKFVPVFDVALVLVDLADRFKRLCRVESACR